MTTETPSGEPRLCPVAGCLFEIVPPAAATDVGGWRFVADEGIDRPAVTLLAVIEPEVGSAAMSRVGAARRWRFRAERPGVARLRFDRGAAPDLSPDGFCIDVAIVPEKLPGAV